ncbi:putative Protein of unknown function (DUF1619) [Blattamonas nauphoetae]|uniref:Tectonic-1-3 N-terminal domain-containing protein n=1 Tax=Blattamonas nauphoetae TaxID=2049346 RepID=A0ABQ9XKY4_9EUKA|nr:putative Protein of unknown function (DUF1619) [Blattamonas nauphoetae]
MVVASFLSLISLILSEPTVNPSDKTLGNCTCDLDPDSCDLMCPCDPKCPAYSDLFPVLLPPHPNSRKAVFCNATDFTRKVNIPSSSYRWGTVSDTMFCIQFQNNPSLGFRYTSIAKEKTLTETEVSDQIKEAEYQFNTTLILEPPTAGYKVGNILYDTTQQPFKFYGGSFSGKCTTFGTIEYGVKKRISCGAGPVTFGNLITMLGTVAITSDGTTSPPVSAMNSAKTALNAEFVQSATIIFQHTTPGEISSVLIIGVEGASDNQHIELGIEWRAEPQSTTHPQSGNPGYLPLSPLLVLDGTDATNPFGYVTVTTPGQQFTELIRFEKNLHFQTVGPTASTPATFFALSNITHIGQYGLADPANPDDWVEVFNEAAPCDGDAAMKQIGSSLQILVENTGFVKNPQPRVVGAQMRSQCVDPANFGTPANHQFFFDVTFVTTKKQQLSEDLLGPPPIARLPEDFLYPIRKTGAFSIRPLTSIVSILLLTFLL